MATRARGIPTPALKLRLAVLGVAVIGGLGLTYLLGSEISHQLTGSLVIDAAGGGRPITGLAVALVAAYLAGVTMILFP